jgi:hypothetical protein
MPCDATFHYDCPKSRHHILVASPWGSERREMSGTSYSFASGEEASPKDMCQSVAKAAWSMQSQRAFRPPCRNLVFRA